jgi:predicted dehydrogenase
MIGIIGGGFGLYGWLPALCQYYPNETIILESKHKEKFDSRHELQRYKDRIKWLYYTEIIIQSELLVLAIPPYEVYSYLDLLLYHNSVKKLIVEKPVCETPWKSREFIRAIENKGIQICSSYLFLYTDWFKELENGNIDRIHWWIKNKNPEDSWKWNHKLGGGPLRFYGIHLIALMAYLGYNIEEGYMDDQILHLLFDKQFQFVIIPNCSYPRFTTFGRRYKERDYIYPFKNNKEDNRIPYIIKLLKDFETDYNKVNKLMKDTNELWKSVEQKLD